MLDTLELWLVRHGETTWNAAGKMAGWSDVPLTEKGMDQAKALRSRLAGTDFLGVWSSTLIRAVETARLAKGDPVTDERLREIHFGDLEGAIWATMNPAHRSALKDFGNFRAPGGETILEAEQRAMDFIESLPPGRHILFTHGGIIRILTRPFGLDQFIDNGELAVLDWTRKKLLTKPKSPSPYR